MVDAQEFALFPVQFHIAEGKLILKIDCCFAAAMGSVAQRGGFSSDSLAGQHT